MTRPATPLDLIAQQGLSQEEYQRIQALLGREPNPLELGIFGVMWSEHCSYKSSRVHLKKFPTQGERVIQGPGENAGVVDLGGGLVAVFKMESHNHPSFVEPYQGAATGVGGILRDIFTMGARPVALLNSLRFGPLSLPHNRYLFEGVVSGIAGYGNCIGVPTIGGEVYFHEIYNRNNLVNVLCLGIAQRDRIVKGQASGEGSPVLYVGSKTGRDGIHGATMASASFDQESETKRPMVQVGDPFTEKRLLEACLEAIDQDLILGMQDMGAGGLSCSASEMASKAGTGMTLELSSVPLREDGMASDEIMLSESQERMLLVPKPGREKEVRRIFEKWELDVAMIGTVTLDGLFTVKDRGRVVVQVPAKALTEEAPSYERPLSPPPYLDAIQSLNLDFLKEPKDFNEVLLSLLSSPTIASKEWVYRQYDHMVQTNTIVLPGSDAAVIRIKGRDQVLAMAVDGNSLYCLLNPYMGATIAVAEAARNLVCAGARPIALTDCLNFGNPEKPEVMWQFALSIEGIADACKRLGVPVVSGNVSFYNETNGIDIYPTPIIGMVGLIEPVGRSGGPAQPMTSWFKRPGDRIVLLGDTKEELGGTEYLRRIFSNERGTPPFVDLEKEAALHALCLSAIESGLLESCHDCSEGGFAVAIAESCIVCDDFILGAEVTLSDRKIRRDALLFGESQSRILVTVSDENLPDFKKLSARYQVPLEVIGRVGGDRLRISIQDSTSHRTSCLVDLELDKIAKAWREAIPEALG
jgi:phosphoribosylformylglycinamidine synthase subunit PurL